MAKSRGMMNNNPGNLIKTSDVWKGEKRDGTDTQFKQFKTLDYGIQAIFRNLRSYFRGGANTVASIINKWDPADTANGNVYKDYVAMSSGFGLNEILTPDKDTLVKLSQGIIRFENGVGNYIPYSKIVAAYNHSTGSSSTPSNGLGFALGVGAGILLIKNKTVQLWLTSLIH